MTQAYGAPAWGTLYDDLPVPSGGLVKVKKLGMDDIVELGMVEQMDFLGAIVDTEHTQRAAPKRPSDHKAKMLTKAEAAAVEEEKRSKQLAAMIGDRDKFRTMVGLIDNIVVASVINPRVVDCRIEEHLDSGDKVLRKLRDDERIDGVIYIDTVPLDDKMAIFDHCFSGVAKMANFREEPTEAVGDVADGEGSELKPEPVTETS